MNGAHGTQQRMGHVERAVDLLRRPAAQSGRRGVTIVKNACLVDLVQLASLCWNVGGGKGEAEVKVASPSPIHLLREYMTIPLLVELLEEWRVQRGRSG